MSDREYFGLERVTRRSIDVMDSTDFDGFSTTTYLLSWNGYNSECACAIGEENTNIVFGDVHVVGNYWPGIRRGK